MVEVPVKIYMHNLAKTAKSSVRVCSTLSTTLKDTALRAMAARLLEAEETILAANTVDVDSVGKNLEREAGREAVKRVRLTSDSVKQMSEGLIRIAEMSDPVGAVTKIWRPPNGIEISRVRVPLGVVALISELGPVHTTEAVGLCLKSGNVCIVRGGADWTRTHQAVMEILRKAAEETGLPAGAICYVDRPEKEGALELMRLNGFVDVIIACGGAGLRKTIIDQAKMPVLCADGGVSHVYVDAEADLPLAQNIVVNSKIQDPTQPNSVDTLLVHQSIARSLLPGLVRRLLEEFKIAVKGCPVTMSLAGTPDLSHYASVRAVTDEDWGKQFLGKVVAVRVVKNLDEALDHIARYGPGLVDVIVTRDYEAAMRFTREVDSSGVFVNVSTRLHEGDAYGLGGHIGLSLNRVHARGPIGLEQLTCEKYVVMGSGQLRHPHPVPVTYEDAIMLKRGGSGF